MRENNNVLKQSRPLFKSLTFPILLHLMQTKNYPHPISHFNTNIDLETPR